MLKSEVIVGMLRIMYIVLAVSLIVLVVRKLYSIYDLPYMVEEVIKGGKGEVIERRVKSLGEFFNVLNDYEGFVVVGVDPDKCGYCRVYRGLVSGLTDQDILVINITDLGDRDLEELARITGIESVPVLIRSYGGGDYEILHVSEGEAEKDLRKLREILGG